MNYEDYPEQEPFSEIGAKYHEEVQKRAKGIIGEDASYGADPYQGVAIYRAQNPNGNVLAFMHGGGWTNGYKEWMAFMAPALTEQGITFVSVGYRLAPRHVFPEGLLDAMGAVDWIYRNIKEYGGDPDRIFVGGHSAGGHYTALAAVKRDWQDTLNLPEDVIKGCLPVSGVFDFTEGSGLSMRPRFLGPENSGAEKPASPVHNIQGTPPPFLMAYGSDDFPHLVKQAEEMDAALKDAGGDAKRLVLEDCNHLSASYITADPDGPWLAKAVEWMAAR